MAFTYRKFKMKSKEEIIERRNDLENEWRYLLSEYNNFEKKSKDPLFRVLLTRMDECAAKLEVIEWILDYEG